jgi:aryl-alcohol dehydrogenase-like predicted oxidoreductase
MESRELGRSGFEVSAIGLGCMGMSEFYGASDDATSINVLHHAIDIGVAFWDTADMYGTGRNEQLVGRAVRGRREQVGLATKFALQRRRTAASSGSAAAPSTSARPATRA